MAAAEYVAAIGITFHLTPFWRFRLVDSRLLA